ncbi:MAG: glycosyltransferase family 1 protein [Bacteroidota bacterium]
MRIGIEAQRLFRKNKHGMDIMALELIKQIQKTDDENEYIIFTKSDKDKLVLPQSNRVKLVVTPYFPYPIWEQIVLPMCVRKYKLDMLHCTSNTAPYWPGTSLLVTLHDLIFMQKWSSSKRGGSLYQRIGNVYRSLLVPRLINRCIGLVTVSDFAKNEIRDHFGLEDSFVRKVHNGFGKHFQGTHSQDEIATFKAHYALKTPFIFFLGNRAPKKNLNGVLLAYASLDKNHPNAPNLVIADLSKKHLHRALDRLGITHLTTKIRLVGYVKNKTLPYFYSQAELFLYPSFIESFGIPILESMACGTPVITSNTSAMPEVAGDAAMLVDPYEPEDIGAAMNLLLTDKQLYDTLVKKGFNRIVRFSYPEMARKTLSTYKSISEKIKVKSIPAEVPSTIVSSAT